MHLAPGYRAADPRLYYLECDALMKAGCQKLFEFMALGLPVVLSDLPPSRPFVGDGRSAIMVAPGDHGAYADAIIRLLRSPRLREEIGRGRDA
jgi:glycosyltransferase involved in cell wall biosynthesis